jgi:lambda family phage tail tape measure protein
MAENQVTISYKTIGLSDLKNAAELIAQTGKHAETTGQAYDALGAAVLRTLKADKQLSTEMRKLNKDRREGKIELKDYIRAEEELYRVRGETINRDKELIRIEGQREKNRKKEAADVERIKEKYDSAYAARKKHDKEITDIEKAFGRGTDKAQRAIAVVTKEYKEFLRATKNGDVIDAGNQFARFSDQAYRAQQRIKRFASVGLQQAGYQVGDFIVQIQSGQNALVALGQQGSQLAGIFGTGGAVVGAGIAAATAIGMIFFEAYKTTNNIKTMDEASSDLSNTISELQDNLDKIADTKLDETFGNMTGSIREMSKELSKLGQLKALRDYQASVMAISAETAGISPTRQFFSGLQTIGEQMIALKPNLDISGQIKEDLADRYIKRWEELGIDMSRAQYDAYRKDLIYQASKGNTEEVTKITEKFTKDATDGAEGFIGMSNDAMTLVFGLSEAAEAMARITAEINGSAAAERLANAQLKERIKLLEEAEEAEAEAAKYTADTVTQLNNQAAVLATSLKSKTAIAALNRQQFMFEQAGKQLSIDELNAIMAAYDNLQKVTGETEAFTEEAKRTQDVLENIDGIISSIRGNISSLETTAIGEAARIAALKAGKTIEESNLAGQVAEKWAAFHASAPADIPDGAMSQREELFLQEIELMKSNNALAAVRKALEDEYRDSKKKTKKEQQDALEKAYEQLYLEREVLKTSDDRRLAIQALGKDYKKYTEEQIKALNKELEMNEQIKQSQALMESVFDSFGDAFTSIVSGTESVKGAFKSMASTIVSELWKIIVVEQMSQSLRAIWSGISASPAQYQLPGGQMISAPLPRPTVNANGNAFYGGNVIPFAKGGVVDSPMMFPMSGGNTGLMGEAGPEAIMPLKRGKGGKLGVVAESQGNVVINQNFNFSANGDESVKKIIAQAAPQIAQMTKSSIINDRRRGGSMKAAFG